MVYILRKLVERMNLEDLQRIAAFGESEQREFKRTTGERKEVAKTLCAMLNGGGGTILIGVHDGGRIIGQQVNDSTQLDLAAEISRIEPAALPTFEQIAIAGDRSVIVLTVPGGGGPFSYDGRPYLRVGPTTRVMPKARYDLLVLERLHGSHRWENQPASRMTVADLDAAEIRRTVDEAIRRGRLDDPGTRDTTELLQGLQLIRDGVPLNAAVVLFGRRDALLPEYPQCVLRMARFRGPDKGDFSDNRQVYGNAFDLLLQAQTFLRDHLPIAGRVVPHVFERQDDPLYPIAALREALANALCHRDYGLGGGGVYLAIYSDRLEITSVGGLPFGLTVADLLRPHTSRLWNPLIAGVFYRRGIIEAWGSGTLKMVELNQAAGLQAPEFIAGAGEVTVRFVPETTASVRPPHELSLFQQELLTLLEQTGSLAVATIAATMTPTPAIRTLQENLQRLRQAGLVELVGRGRAARWQIVGTKA